MNTDGGDADLDEGQDVGPVLLLLRMIAKKRYLMFVDTPGYQ